MSAHWVVLPFLLPLLTGALLLFVRSPGAQRAVSIGSALVLAFICLRIAVHASGAAPLIYALGNWPAHLGVVLVLDGVSALMLCLAAAVALPALWYATQGWDTRGRHFHALFQFQLAGLNGAFLTGDLFNLFVCFELMLIASYALLVHGGGTARLRAGVHYVTLNLVGSALFLVAVSLLYRVGGTLNMADLGQALADASPADLPWVRAGSLLLVVVFLLKGASVPLYLWLPGTYGAASAPVAAIFAVLTKVGAYALLRVTNAVFAPAGAAELIGLFVPALAAATLLVAAAGAFSARRLSTLVAWLALGSSASVLVGVSAFTPAAIAAGLFYAVPSTLALAALFLLADAIARARGAEWGDRLERAPAPQGATALGLWFFVAAIAVAGLPPFGAFLGKAMLLSGIGPRPVFWFVILLASLVNLVALCRAGIRIFWATTEETSPGDRSAASASRLLPAGALVAAVAATTVGAGVMERYVRDAVRTFGAFKDAAITVPVTRTLARHDNGATP